LVPTLWVRTSRSITLFSDKQKKTFPSTQRESNRAKINGFSETAPKGLLNPDDIYIDQNVLNQKGLVVIFSLQIFAGIVEGFDGFVAITSAAFCCGVVCCGRTQNYNYGIFKPQEIRNEQLGGTRYTPVMPQDYIRPKIRS
jgi:hypothetical protein